MSFRPERLAEAIKKEISELLRDELKDPRIGFVSITSVDVSRDLRYANVFASVFGEPAVQKASSRKLPLKLCKRLRVLSGENWEKESACVILRK